jgi:hypothetical protein
VESISIEAFVATDTDSIGERSIFDLTDRAATLIRTDTSQMTKTLGDFCNAFADGIQEVARVFAKDKYALDAIELSVEITSKGEI